MDFRFLQNENKDAQFEGLHDQQPLGGRPAVYLSVSHTRDSLSDEQFDDICKAQRLQLIERMFEYLLVTHTIVSQDNIGFTLRTEINL
jgi:hypothetical protein